MTLSAIGRCRIAGFSLTTADAEGLARFYERGFGCTRGTTTRLSGIDGRDAMGARGRALSITLRLGGETIELLQFDEPGQPYPTAATARDPIFQHFALVVRDIGAAYRRLCAMDGWTAISTGGPEHLPATSGGVSAFKFRDPEGHPLELLAFPADRTPPVWQALDTQAIFLGIDHSAISVADIIRSARFYEKLGLKVSSRSYNEGLEQHRLDGLSETGLDVMGLSTAEAKPHLELLRYAGAHASVGLRLNANDIAATRIILQAYDGLGIPMDAVGPHLIHDPDGHHIVIR